MEQPLNKLTPAEVERLVWLAEEAAEVAQAAMKVLRHGYDDYNPMDPDGTSNRDHLAKEIGQFSLVVSLMITSDDLDMAAMSHAAEQKIVSAEVWLHHNTLEELKDA